MIRKISSAITDTMRLISPYWHSDEKWLSGFILFVIICINLGIVYLNVLFNDWNGLFYNALQDKDYDSFVHQFIRFGYLAAIFIVLGVYRLYLRQMLQIRWRRWLTQRYVGRWFENHTYYHLQMAPGGQTDNPDQRIADDINGFVGQVLVLGLGFLEAVVNLISFAGILWGLSGAIVIAGLTINGYMLWVAVVYAIIGTYLTHIIGRPLIGLNFQQQKFEADFRFSLVRLRENAEGVALYRGEPQEAAALSDRFTHVVENWWSIMRRQKWLTWFSSGYGQLAIVFPFIVAAPRFFSGAIELGGLMQVSSAFGQVQSSLSWFIDAYTSLADFKATIDRLTTFEHALSTPPAPKEAIPAMETGDAVVIRDLDLFLPDGTPLIERFNARWPAGARILVTGPSGTGKSTLFRAIAGLWPYRRGGIAMPANARFLFLPQKPYLPIARLRNVVSYPDPATTKRDDDIVAALNACGLPQLAGRLDEDAHWGQRLSPGEQQRLAFARALLYRPDWLFLDEATSAVDEPGEAALYRLLLDRLPGCSIISIAHRPTLVEYHGQTVTLAGVADHVPASV